MAAWFLESCDVTLNGDTVANTSSAPISCEILVAVLTVVNSGSFCLKGWHTLSNWPNQQFPLWQGIQVSAWWRHQMETISALLTLCAGKDQWRGALMLSLICALTNGCVKNRRWWFETPSHSIWCHCNGLIAAFGTQPCRCTCAYHMRRSSSRSACKVRIWNCNSVLEHSRDWHSWNPRETNISPIDLGNVIPGSCIMTAIWSCRNFLS